MTTGMLYFAVCDAELSAYSEECYRSAGCCMQCSALLPAAECNWHCIHAHRESQSSTISPVQLGSGPFMTKVDSGRRDGPVDWSTSQQTVPAAAAGELCAVSCCGLPACRYRAMLHIHRQHMLKAMSGKLGLPYEP